MGNEIRFFLSMMGVLARLARSCKLMSRSVLCYPKWASEDALHVRTGLSMLQAFGGSSWLE